MKKLILLTLLLSACAKSPVPTCEHVPIGRIIEVREIPTAFNQPTRLEIRTETLYLQVLRSEVNLVPYTEAEILVCDNDISTVWLSWAGASKAVRVIR